MGAGGTVATGAVSSRKSQDQGAGAAKTSRSPAYERAAWRCHVAPSRGRRWVQSANPGSNGERLVGDVYAALRANRAPWKSTLLVVAYDEHGGFYDHVSPPPAIPPDDHPEEYTFDQMGSNRDLHGATERKAEAYC